MWSSNVKIAKTFRLLSKEKGETNHFSFSNVDKVFSNQINIFIYENYGKDEIWDRCYSIIKEASENRAVLNVLWHQESFSESDFPFYTEIYKRIIETSFEADAKIITLGELSESILVR